MQLKKMHKGYTLTELMVALVINAFFFTALMAVFMSNVTHYAKTLQVNVFNQQMNSAMLLMTQDIRRAGYWSNAKTDIGSPTNNNPFMVVGADLITGLSNTCVLFSYDRNSLGVMPAINSVTDDLRYGYRLNNGILQTRPWGATFACTAAANAWENVTDPKILNLTALTFVLTSQSVSSGPKIIIERSIDITMTGQSTVNPSISKTLTQHVRIENDNYSP